MADGEQEEEEMGRTNEFDLPNEVLHVLPSDPFTQLDIARKITSIALSTRVSALESEASVLRAQLTERENIIADLQSQLESLDASLSDTVDRLNRAEQEKENLLKENSSLSSTVNKLRRDVAKLEVFRKTLMQSLQEEEDGSTGVQAAVAKELQSQTSLSAQSQSGDDDITLPPSAYSSTSESLDRGNSVADDPDTEASRPRISPGLLLASLTSTPRLTPPGSPPSMTPSRTSKPTSPRRHSVSFSTSRGLFDSNQGSFSSTDGGSQSGRPRVDGKEFFRQVRSRLSYEQFAAFLANVKELNSHKQTKEVLFDLLLTLNWKPCGKLMRFSAQIIETSIQFLKGCSVATSTEGVFKFVKNYFLYISPLNFPIACVNYRVLCFVSICHVRRVRYVALMCMEKVHP